MLKKIIYLFFLFPVIAKADIQSHERYYSFLSQGFNIHNYQQCDKLIQSCPVDIFPDPDCVAKILQTKKICQQFARLTDVLGDWLITVKQIASFSLITETTLGDGQNNYYILSKGYLINTNIDPRELDANLAKKYKNTSLFIVNWGEPQYQKNKDGSQSFMVVLNVTDGCLACPRIALATLEFKFSPSGNFIGKQLINFQLTSDSLKK